MRWGAINYPLLLLLLITYVISASILRGHYLFSYSMYSDPAESSSPHLPFNHEGRWGSTDDFTTSFTRFSLSSTALWDLAISRPACSLMLFSNLSLCLVCLLPPFTVPCKMILARPDELQTCPYHCSLRLFTMVKRSSCDPTACWILARTSSLVTWSLYEIQEPLPIFVIHVFRPGRIIRE